MSEECPNCGAAIRDASGWGSANYRYDEPSVAMVNFVNNMKYDALCTKCGASPIGEAHDKIDREIRKKTVYCQENISDFPMFTLSWLPASVRIKLKNMITANVTVGTGFFSEFSQGFSDTFGLVNEKSGMSLKVNKGEAAARSILVTKALAIGANCIVGVDIDYGITGNNAATVNMQGTAAVIENLSDILDDTEIQRASAFSEAQKRIAQLHRWKANDISS